MNDDERWMAEAMEEGHQALRKGEVPIGAILVLDGQIVGKGHNARITLTDPTAHAEIGCIRDAAKKIRNYRIPGGILYVTVEPCPMCFGAIMEARIQTLVYGIREPKWGVAGSLYDLQNDPRFPHRVAVREGVLSGEISNQIKQFFREKRG
ncbi:MAG: tRNA adenosine(34) deaminase TadA [Leptospirales bacterium]